MNLKLVRLAILTVYALGCFAVFPVIADASSPQCINPEGKAVQYWVALKPPDTKEKYYYRDSESSPCLPGMGGSCFGRVRSDLNGRKTGPLAKTLLQIYAAQSGTNAYVMYNDDAPSLSQDKLAPYAHAKGVFAFNTVGGFWLVHSLPRFPFEAVGISYAGLSDNGRVNAQIFFCMTLKSAQVKSVARQLDFINPRVYQKGGFTPEIEAFLEDSLKEFNKEIWPKESLSSVVDISPDDMGTTILSFVKNQAWGKDFYDDLIAPAFNSDLMVNSWNNGSGTLPSFCANGDCRRRRFSDRQNVCLPSCAQTPSECIFQYDVQNVQSVALDDSARWTNSKDHSKWAVSTSAGREKVFCVGDINRQRGQRRRGGGAVCLIDENLWQAFSNLIKDSEICE